MWTHSFWTWQDGRLRCMGRLKIGSQKTFIQNGHSGSLDAVVFQPAWLQIVKFNTTWCWDGQHLYNSGIPKQRFGMARFILIAYIASGHFIHTATKNPFLLRMITQAGRCGWTGEPRIHSKSSSLNNVFEEQIFAWFITCILYTVYCSWLKPSCPSINRDG